ncbi:uncharacterized protein LOC143154337 isoform X2 [Ptiloglossa arizonensis]|uniref:uncharacterized protein LOC143154337 isoform X2 n=1 Tax=Ptiloglossa arizonensis TaxID=3350558 RepID=UPI003F9F3EEF
MENIARKFSLRKPFKDVLSRKSLLPIIKDRSILLTPPWNRTSIEKKYLLELFKKFRIFRKYPDKLKNYIAGICQYQYVQPGRVIVQQGRIADNLYFIIEGEVTSSKMVTDRWTGESKEINMGILTTGDIFGETALLHNVLRVATVISKTNVDLLLIPREDFDKILRPYLSKEWDVLQDALVHFDYFKSWDAETIRECCILSRIENFQPDEVLLGDGKGMINYAHFILDGECRLIEHMIVRERIFANKVRYKLYEPRDSVLQKEAKRKSKETEIIDDKTEKPDFKCKAARERANIIHESVDDHTSVDYDKLVLSSKTTTKQINFERESTITTTLLDVINEWQKITDVAQMLMREPSSISQQCYPPDVRTIFMQICTFNRGACFGLGEDMYNRRIVSVTPVRCFLIPRYFLNKHNRANIWERVKLFIESKYPSKEKLFKEFVRNRRWLEYKRNLIDDINKRGRRIHSNVTIHDVPYAIRIVNDFGVLNNSFLK